MLALKKLVKNSLRSKLQTDEVFNVISKSFSDECNKSKSSSRICNLKPECMEMINKQVLAELAASYAYLNLAWIFGHDSCSLPGFLQLFKRFSSEEIEHAWKLIDYSNLRGGEFHFKDDIKNMIGDKMFKPLEAVDKAIELEQIVTKMLEDLHDKASQLNDKHLVDFLDSEFISEQYKGIKDLADLRKQIERVGDGEGLYLLDSQILANELKNK